VLNAAISAPAAAADLIAQQGQFAKLHRAWLDSNI
jgi:hypothetical protein